MALVPKRFGFIRTTLALWGADLFANRAGVVTDAPKDAGTLETWGWYDGSQWRYAARRGGDETFGNISVTGLTSTGTVTATRSTAGETSLQVSSQAGSAATLRLQTNGVDRWLFRKNGTAEPGGGTNAGSNIEFVALDDAGTLIDFPINIVRAAGGAMTLTRPLNLNSTVTMPNTIAQQKVSNSGSGATLVQAVTIPNAGGIYEVTVATSLNNGGLYGVRTQKWLVNAFMAFPYTAYAPATQSLMDVATVMTGSAPTCALATAVSGSLTFTVGGTGTKKIDIAVRKLCDQASI